MTHLVSITLWFLNKNPIEFFPLAFWIVVENKLFDKDKFMILTRFLHHDNLQKCT